MSEYVYSINDGYVQNPAGGMVPMRPGQVWFADDPFVVARPDLFSATSPRVHSTVGRETPRPVPLSEQPRPKARRA